MNYTITHCGIVILAAGQSSRMGTPKQLLSFDDEPLLLRMVKVAKRSRVNPVIAVVGAGKDSMLSLLKDQEVETVFSEQWQEGMGASLRSGLQFLIDRFPSVDGVLFMVCDQPFVTAELIHALFDKQRESGKPAVASFYQGRMGTPALFHKFFFSELLKIEGDMGARNLLATYDTEVALVNFEKGAIDIDTPEDFQKLEKAKTVGL